MTHSLPSQLRLGRRSTLSLLARVLTAAMLAAIACALIPARALAQRDTTIAAGRDSVTIRLVDVDLRTAVEALSQYLDRTLISNVQPGVRVTLSPPRPVTRSEVAGLLRSLLESNGYELATDSGGLYRARTRQPARPAAQADAALARAPRAPGFPELFVIRLRHARAADVAATVNSLYGIASALGERGIAGPGGGTLADQLRDQQIGPAGPPPAQAVSAVAGRSAALSGQTTIVPDPTTNSLLVRASRDDFDLIEAAVRQIDVRPLQVLIEVLVVEARRDRSLEFGIGESLGITRIKGTRNGRVTATNAGTNAGDLAITLMGLGSVDLKATITAAASRGDVKIMSRPVVLAANNELAEISVGSQRPFVQLQRSIPGGDQGVLDQVVQYRDVGIRLSVRPTISSDGYVTLEVTQEVNAATPDAGALGAPVISTRSVRTQLLVKDDHTAVLGGLTEEQRDRTQGGIPYLSGIPVLGGLFGRARKTKSDTELFLFLTPRVIRSDEETRRVTEPLEKRAKEIEP